jgi:hypothetical protein
MLRLRGSLLMLAGPVLSAQHAAHLPSSIFAALMVQAMCGKIETKSRIKAGARAWMINFFWGAFALAIVLTLNGFKLVYFRGFAFDRYRCFYHRLLRITRRITVFYFTRRRVYFSASQRRLGSHIFKKWEIAQTPHEFVDALQAAYADNCDGEEEEENDAPERVDDGGVFETFDDGGSMSQMAANLLPR